MVTIDLNRNFGWTLVWRMTFLSCIDEVMSAAFTCVFLLLLVELADGTVLLIGRNMSKSFDDIDVTSVRVKVFFFPNYIEYMGDESKNL